MLILTIFYATDKTTYAATKLCLLKNVFKMVFSSM